MHAAFMLYKTLGYPELRYRYVNEIVAFLVLHNIHGISIVGFLFAHGVLSISSCDDILLTSNQLTRIRYPLIHYLLRCCMCGAGEQAQAEREDSKSHSCKWILLNSQVHLTFYLII